MQRSQIRTRVAFSAALSALTLPLLSPAAGAATVGAERVERAYTDAHGVLHYAFEPTRFPSAAVVEERGTRTTSGACEFTGEAAGTPNSTGARIMVIRELTFDAARCERALAVASYSAQDAPPFLRRELDAASADGARVGRPARTDGGVSTAATVIYVGVLKVNVETPAQIDVSTTKANLDWSGASCVTNGWHEANWGWWSGGGWRRTSSSWSYDLSCSRAYTNVLGTYTNGSCSTNHAKTWFEGRPYGGWYWSYDVSKSGSCVLHYEYILTTP